MSRTLLRAPELEAAIREEPWDEARWSALEAFLLAHRDPRSELIEALRVGTAGDVALVLGRTEKLLFGKVPRSFHVALDPRGREWRAGFLRACTLLVNRGGRDASSLVRALSEAAASALLRELTLYPTGGYVRAATLVEELGGAPFAPWLRRLRVLGESGWLSPELLVPFCRLEHLDVGSVLLLGRVSQELETLRCLYPRSDDGLALFAPGAHPRLTSLHLVTPFGFGQSSRATLTGLDALFDGSSAPNLQRVVVEGADAAAVALLKSLPTRVPLVFE